MESDNQYEDRTHTEEERTLWDEEGGPEPSEVDSGEMQIRSSASTEINGSRTALPVWMRESSKSFNWGWVPLSLREVARSSSSWSKGPEPPHIQKIRPLFPSIQEAPLKFIDQWFPTRNHKAALLTLYSLTWLLIFSLVLRRSATSGNIEGFGQPQSIWCGANLWGNGNDCGMDGNNCRPFDGATFPFKCSADCLSTKVLNPKAVGDQEALYQPFVIGGSHDHSQIRSPTKAHYRGDSYICQAAIHAGIISNTQGGCGVLALTGRQDDFPSINRNDITSIGFNATFPKSFSFVSDIPTDCGNVDLRWPLLTVTVTFTAVLSMFTSSPAVFFSFVFTMLFFHTGLVSDPPNTSDYPSLLSLIVERFLPAAFVGFVLYRYCVKPQLLGLTAQFEKTILWLGGAWVGALNNYTFDLIPISRLTPHDLRQQPGAQSALVIIVLCLIIIALGQAWYLRQEGKFRRYLAVYASMGALLLIGIAIPQLSLRIHHYVLALLLLPGTGIQTRPSLLYQGILIGLFVNGVARWGFDSILQTAGALRGDGQLDSLLPNMTYPFLGASNITFEWALPPEPYDGISVLVNDVERHRWYHGEGEPRVTWTRDVARERQFFRFAFMSGSGAGDYTKAGLWHLDGTWTPMKPGPSR